MAFELWVLCGIILLCVILSGFFSGSETALTAASRARMLTLEHNGDVRDWSSGSSAVATG